MKIQKAKSAGFCFGVRRAIGIALALARRKGARVCMLGDIVHNEEVIRGLREAGVKSISRLGGGAGKTLLIRAHGAPRRLLERARQRGYKVADATCPMVRAIHRLAAVMEKEGRRIIVIGDPNHDEVEGILGNLRRKAVVLGGPADPALARAGAARKAALLAQSTQDTETVLRVARLLAGMIPDFVFCDTVCRPTRMKQAEARSMAARRDVMIVIGSETSANTRRLYEISKAINPRTWRIGTAAELRPRMFAGAASVGVTAGASTPDGVIEAVLRRIAGLGAGRRARARRD